MDMDLAAFFFDRFGFDVDSQKNKEFEEKLGLFCRVFMNISVSAKTEQVEPA